MHGRSSFARRAKKALVTILVGALAFPSVSCGTLIHPERVGQPPSGQLDPSIVLLDALGLIVFVIPGVIGFVVDFSTGAIYLPPRYAPVSYSGPVSGPPRMTRIQVDPATLTTRKIEAVVLEQTGQAVDLAASDVRARKVDDLGSAASLLGLPVNGGGNR